MSLLTIILLICTISIPHYEAAKILAMFPTPSISHQVVFRPLTQELAKRGHEVTVITTDPAFPKGGTPTNLTEIDVHDFSYETISELYKMTSSDDTDVIELMRVALHALTTVVEMQLNVDEVQKLIKEEKFDLLMLEAYVRPTLVLSHVFKAPVIQVSSFGPTNFNLETIGSSWHPLLYPSTMSVRSYNMTTWEKIVELWNFYKLENVMYEGEEVENGMAKRMFGPNMPTIRELKNNVDMLFLNVHPVWESNRPVPPSVVYMGGLHQNPEKELPTDLKNYLDSSKNGVVYMSLGTNVKPSMLPPERVQMLVKVFSQLPYDVLWKWDKDELPGRTANIRVSKWLPQSDLLRHPKIKAFITQGGLQSTDEAITAGVPLIGIPLFGDQWFNVEKYLYHKIGVKLELKTLTEEEFRNAINTVTGDESYRSNIVKLRSVMRDDPQRPLDRVIWWTEYVLRHGGARHLRSPAANLSWAEYLELEVVLILLAIVLGLFSVLLVLVYYLWKFLSKSSGVSLKVKTK